MSGKWKSEDVGKSGRTSSQNHAWIKKSILLVSALYVGYVAYHTYTASNKGCSLDMTLLTMFPIRELYTIPAIDRGFVQAFNYADSVAENPAPGLTHLLGWGLKNVVTDLFLTPDICLLISSLSELSGDVDSIAVKPTEVKPFVRYVPSATLTPVKRQAELIPPAAWLYIIPQKSSRRIAICGQSDIQSVATSAGAFYRVRCEGKLGWIQAEHIRLLDGR